MISQEQLKQQLHYNPETGLFTRLVSNTNRTRVGDIAGCTNRDGYIQIRVLGKEYKAHRLVFLYMTGKFPKDQADHLDHDRKNNQWGNLREASHLDNGRNQGITSNNTSGFNGIGWSERDKKWYARIRVDGKKKHLGVFDLKKDAVKARKDANLKYGFHANHGE